MDGRKLYFDWLEYLVFGLSLSVSALIGVYFGFIKGGQNTVDGYLFGGKQMGLFPVSVSLICSYISGVTLLGIPTEVYTYGSQYMISVFGQLCMGVFLAYVIIPVFYKIQIFSLFQYLELRFDSTVRKVVSAIFTVYLLLYIPIVIYGPGLALNQVTGLSVLGTTLTISIVCIFYTTVGGLQAVVWTDTLQGLVMAGAMITVAAMGTDDVGGLSAVINASEQGNRLQIFNFDPDPRQRTTFWTISIGCTFIFTSSAAINPSYPQRFISLPTMRKAQWSALYMALGASLCHLISSYMGLVIYTKYKDCDPALSKKIERPDQLLPFFVVDALANVRGLPGIFVAGVVCAALSTMSTGVNTVAGTIYSDFVEPWKGRVGDSKASWYIKLISAGFGTLCLGLVLVVDRMGAILELTFAILGLSAGALLGVVILALFVPQANSKGVIFGCLGSMCIMAWILVGNRSAVDSKEIVYEAKPVSMARCDSNITYTDSTHVEPKLGETFPLFEISFFYFCLIGCLLSVIIGVGISYVTGPNRVQDVRRDLLSPLVYPLLPDYSEVPCKEVELKDTTLVTGLWKSNAEGCS